MERLSNAILKEAEHRPEGAFISAKELLHLGKRAAVDQALTRLVKRRRLMRASRGIYVRPVQTRFGIRAPAPEKIVSRLNETHSEIVTRHGAAAANALGLTTQVPSKAMYYTSGPSRRFKSGAQAFELKHVPMWLLLAGQSQAGETVRALEWVGRAHATEALRKLKPKLSQMTVEQLLKLRQTMPSWLAKSVGEALAAHA